MRNQRVNRTTTKRPKQPAVVLVDPVAAPVLPVSTPTADPGVDR